MHMTLAICRLDHHVMTLASAGKGGIRPNQGSYRAEGYKVMIMK